MKRAVILFLVALLYLLQLFQSKASAASSCQGTTGDLVTGWYKRTVKPNPVCNCDPNNPNACDPPCTETCTGVAPVAEFCSDYIDCAGCVSVNFSSFDCGNKGQCKWNGLTSCAGIPTSTPTPTPAPDAPLPDPTPVIPGFDTVIQVLGVVYEDANKDGNFDAGEKIFGPKGGVNMDYVKSNGTPASTTCKSTDNTRVREVLTNGLAVYPTNQTSADSLERCYTTWFNYRAREPAFLEPLGGCAGWAGKCQRTRGCNNCGEYNGIDCTDETGCPKNIEDRMKSNAFFQKLRDVGLGANYIGSTGEASIDINDIIPVFGPYGLNLTANPSLKLRLKLPTDYKVTGAHLISTYGSNTPLVDDPKASSIRNMGASLTVGGWYASPVLPTAVVAWGIIYNKAEIRVKGHKVTSGSEACSAIANADPLPLDGTTFGFTGSSKNYALYPGGLVQAAGAYVAFTGLTPGKDSIYGSTSPYDKYIPTKYCRSVNGGAYTDTYTVTTTANDLVTFDIGYISNEYTLEASAHEISDPNATCDTIAISPDLVPTDFALTAGSRNDPTSGTQSTATPLSIPNLIIGTDTLTSTPAVGYVAKTYCRSIAGTPGYIVTDIASGQSNGDIVRFDAGYIKNMYTLTAKTHKITNVNATCDDIKIDANPLNGVTVSFDQPASGNNPAPQTTSGGAGVDFLNLPIATDYITATPPAGSGYSVLKYCLSKNAGAPSLSDPPVASGQQPNDIYQFDVAFVYGTPWVQVQGGHVTARTSVSSPIPDSVTAGKRMLLVPDAANVLAGLVTYGTTADFDPSPGVDGIPAKVSGNTWLLGEQYAVKDYYTQFYNRFGAPTTADYPEILNVVTKPVYDPDLVPPKKYYYVTGDMETSGDWTINTGESYVFIVNGNLTIKTPVTRAGTGFIAFIVSGTITVDSSLVGVAPASESPVVEGLYIANGTFATGATTIAGKEKFVGRGTFIAGNFSLERNLDALSSGNNARYPSELFIYDPQLPFLVPDAFKETSITWQEVAP